MVLPARGLRPHALLRLRREAGSASYLVFRLHGIIRRALLVAAGDIAGAGRRGEPFQLAGSCGF